MLKKNIVQNYYKIYYYYATITYCTEIIKLMIQRFKPGMPRMGGVMKKYFKEGNVS